MSNEKPKVTAVVVPIRNDEDRRALLSMCADEMAHQEELRFNRREREWARSLAEAWPRISDGAKATARELWPHLVPGGAEEWKP